MPLPCGGGGGEAEGQGAVAVAALMVRPAAREPRHHPAEQGRIGSRAVETQFSADAAHFAVLTEKRPAHRAGLGNRRAWLTAPPELTEPRTFVELPARYAAWARSAGLVRPPTPDGAGLMSEQPPRVSVTSPPAGLRLLRDPETPAEQATLSLSAVVDPPGAQVVWYVDGAPWQVVDYPYQTRWALQPGEHTFQARLPRLGAASTAVKVRVD